MTKAAVNIVARIAQVATGDLLLGDTIGPGRELYATKALRLVPNPTVCVNHDEDRPIGRVLELEEWDFADGKWVVARCQLDNAPDWLRGGSYGTGCSMSWINLSHSQEMPGGWRRYNGGLVREVSILSAGFTPKEPTARVVVLNRESPMGDTTRAEPGTFYGGPLIRRPSIGHVVAVY